MDGNKLDERLALKKLLKNGLDMQRRDKEKKELLKNVFLKNFKGLLG